MTEKRPKLLNAIKVHFFVIISRLKRLSLFEPTIDPTFWFFFLLFPKGPYSHISLFEEYGGQFGMCYVLNNRTKYELAWRPNTE